MKRTHFMRVGVVIMLGTAIMLAFYYRAQLQVSDLAAWLQEFGFWSVVVFIGMYAIAAVLLIFAASLLGFREIRLPSGLTQAASQSYSGYFGSLFMGLILGVIAAPCRELDEITFRDPNVVAMSEEKIVMIKVDLTRKGDVLNDRLVQEYDVKGVPTVLFIDRNGVERPDLRLSDFIPPDQFLIRLAELIKVGP